MRSLPVLDLMRAAALRAGAILLDGASRGAGVVRGLTLEAS